MNSAYLIKNAKIISGGKQFLSSVLIEQDRIVALGDKAIAAADDWVNVIDASGCTLIPGLVDAHCHISFDRPKSNDELFFHRRPGLASIVASVNAQKVLRAGVTSFFDADCIFDVGIDLRDAMEAGVIEGPRMATGGNALITSVGGTAGRLLPDSGKLGYAVIVQTGDEIVREIRCQVKAGCDWIKVHVSGLPVRKTPMHGDGEIQAWTLDELRLVCDTAHSLGVPVVGHCRNASSTRDAALAGFDMILHASYMDEEALGVVIDKGVPLVPTFTFLANLIDYGDKVGADPALQNIFRNEIAQSSTMLRRAYDAGVPLMCGSESGFSVTPYGDWHYREMGLFVEHLGLTPLEAVACATEAGASIFGLQDELGRIEENYIADLVLVEGDLEADINLLGEKNNIRAVFKAGKLVNTDQPLPGDWNIPGWRAGQYSTDILTYDLAHKK